MILVVCNHSCNRINGLVAEIGRGRSLVLQAWEYGSCIRCYIDFLFGHLNLVLLLPLLAGKKICQLHVRAALNLWFLHVLI